MNQKLFDYYPVIDRASAPDEIKFIDGLDELHAALMVHKAVVWQPAALDVVDLQAINHAIHHSSLINGRFYKSMRKHKGGIVAEKASCAALCDYFETNAEAATFSAIKNDIAMALLDMPMPFSTDIYHRYLAQYVEETRDEAYQSTGRHCCVAVIAGLSTVPMQIVYLPRNNAQESKFESQELPVTEAIKHQIAGVVMPANAFVFIPGFKLKGFDYTYFSPAVKVPEIPSNVKYGLSLDYDRNFNIPRPACAGGNLVTASPSA